MLLNAANGEVSPIPDCALKFLENDVDIECLKIQVAMVTNMIKTAFTGQYAVTKVTNVRTIATGMNRTEIYSEMLTEIDNILPTLLHCVVKKPGKVTTINGIFFSSLRQNCGYASYQIHSAVFNKLNVFFQTSSTSSFKVKVRDFLKQFFLFPSSPVLYCKINVILQQWIAYNYESNILSEEEIYIGDETSS